MDSGLRDHVHMFLESINHFLELLLGIRNLPESEEWQDDRVIGTLRLMAFIEKRHRAIFVRYVHRLVDFHVASGQFTEAGLTLKMHADLYEFDPRRVASALPDLDLMEQSEFNRKELLFLRILDYLSRGQAYETAIGISKGELGLTEGRSVTNHITFLQSCSNSMKSTYTRISDCRSYLRIRQTYLLVSSTRHDIIHNTSVSGFLGKVFQPAYGTSNSYIVPSSGKSLGWLFQQRFTIYHILIISFSVLSVNVYKRSTLKLRSLEITVFHRQTSKIVKIDISLSPLSLQSRMRAMPYCTVRTYRQVSAY